MEKNLRKEFILSESGKINALVVIIIILVQLLLSVCIYVFVLREADEKPKETMSLLPRVETPQPQRSNTDDTRRNDRSFNTSNFYGARDYTREYTLFSLGDLVVNPASSGSGFFLSTILFEYRQSDKRLPDELKNKAPMFKDRIIQYFSRLTIDDLRDIENRDVFREDIMRIINNLLVEGRITDVFFEQFVLQG